MKIYMVVFCLIVFSVAFLVLYLLGFDSGTIYSVLGISSVATLALLYKTSREHIKCPSCGNEIKNLRMPSSFRQLLFGGWNCGQCGTSISGKEKIITVTSNKNG